VRVCSAPPGAASHFPRHARPVGQVFSSVASSYDLMNDAMSLGIHRLWKDRFVSFLDPGSPPGGLKCLDVAGGTGDIALRILDHAREKHADRETSVHVVDISPSMLEVGKKRFAKSMYHATPQVAFSVGNAEDLAGTARVGDESVDLYTIAFGIRNCTNVQKVLDEAFRVVKRGGRFSCLEFSKVNNPLLAKCGLLPVFAFCVPLSPALTRNTGPTKPTHST
jgi:2-methoxy-6-polyprenyl-1,4-benzoquinol methylase